MRSDDPSCARVNGAREDASVCDANFYALPFASQMIVWALRKRLHALAHGGTDDDVLRVFHMANWGALYAALLSVVDLLVAADVRERLQCHAVSCPCIAPHEAYLLNALACLQDDRCDAADLCVSALMRQPRARLALQHLAVIAGELRELNLPLVYVDLASHARVSSAPTPQQRRHVH